MKMSRSTVTRMVLLASAGIAMATVPARAMAG